MKVRTSGINRTFDKTRAIILIILIANLAQIVIIHETYNPLRSISNSIITTSEQEIIDDCSGMDVFDASDCLLSHIYPIWNYTLRDDRENPTLEELKTEGGDCEDWSNVYAELGSSLGFYSRTFAFQTDEDMGHQIAIISSPEGYCILDQTEIDCVALGGEDES